jgi:hypothetical protein
MLLQNNLLEVVVRATTFSSATLAAAQLHKLHACQEVWIKLAQQLLENPGEILVDCVLIIRVGSSGVLWPRL